MARKSLLIMPVAVFVSACSCIAPAPQSPPAGQAASSTEPAPMVKEAEQVIAIAEKESAAAGATPVASISTPGVTRCWLKNDLRTLAIEQGQDGSCQVIYESAGQNHVVANKSKDLSDCTRLHARLKKNLLASGFSCE